MEQLDRIENELKEVQRDTKRILALIVHLNEDKIDSL